MRVGLHIPTDIQILYCGMCTIFVFNFKFLKFLTYKTAGFNTICWALLFDFGDKIGTLVSGLHKK